MHGPWRVGALLLSINGFNLLPLGPLDGSRVLERVVFSRHKLAELVFAGLSAGMGLGLSFVTVILAHHGATLDIESTPLQGATFRVSFPRG